MRPLPYILDHHNVDWPCVLRDWAWLLPERFTVWIMNPFGDLFLILDDGTVHMLDVGGGTLTKVAADRDDFAAKADDEDNANVWFMIPLIDRLIAAGLTLGEGQCYSYKQPPLIGGDYTVENTCVLDIATHYAFYGMMHRQMKDLPDGTPVRIVVNEQPRET